jgi:hypothetical protein
MEQSPSWNSNSSSATQEIPRILWNPKIRYRIHKNPPLPVLSHIDPIHAPIPFLEVPSNTVLASTSVSFKWSLSIRLPPLKPSTRLFPYVLHVLPTSVLFIWSREQYLVKSTENKAPSSLPCYLYPLGPKYPPQHPIHQNPQPAFLLQCEQPSFTPIQGKIIVL